MSYTYKRASQPSLDEIRTAIEVLEKLAPENGSDFYRVVLRLRAMLAPKDETLPRKLQQLVAEVARSDRNLDNVKGKVFDGAVYTVHGWSTEGGELTLFDHALPRHPPDDDGPGDRAYYDRARRVAKLVEGLAQKILPEYDMDHPTIEKQHYSFTFTLRK